MKVKVYIQVVCPKCNMVMESHEDKYVSCESPSCKLRGEKFNLPTIELTRYAQDCVGRNR